jgi:hypothetical protein
MNNLEWCLFRLSEINTNWVPFNYMIDQECICSCYGRCHEDLSDEEVLNCFCEVLNQKQCELFCGTIHHYKTHLKDRAENIMRLIYE